MGFAVERCTKPRNKRQYGAKNSGREQEVHHDDLYLRLKRQTEVEEGKQQKQNPERHEDDRRKNGRDMIAAQTADQCAATEEHAAKKQWQIDDVQKNRKRPDQYLTLVQHNADNGECTECVEDHR